MKIEINLERKDIIKHGLINILQQIEQTIIEQAVDWDKGLRCNSRELNVCRAWLTRKINEKRLAKKLSME